MSQVVECATCGRAAMVVCGVCLGVQDGMEATEPKRYTVEEIEEMILRWCGWPDRTIDNLRYALKAEDTTARERRLTTLKELPE